MIEDSAFLPPVGAVAQRRMKPVSNKGNGQWPRESQFVEKGRTRFRYDYDFGDHWAHAIEVETTLRARKGDCNPRCVAGKRACPPEDCGGPYSDHHFLERLEDPDDPEHEETLEWVGGEFDPEKFDRDRVNEELYELRRWLGRRRGAHALPAAFAKGDLARVKPGVAHDRCPDIPLSGWVGRIKRLGWLVPTGYAGIDNDNSWDNERRQPGRPKCEVVYDRRNNCHRVAVFVARWFRSGLWLLIGGFAGARTSG